MKISPNDACPCDSGLSYKNCCQPLRKGAKAASPEALMRSRYSAYALHLTDYIIKTTHPEGLYYRSGRAAWKRDIESFSQNTRFARLQILAAKDDMVTFRATLFANNQDVSFTEISVFRQHDGQWKYYSGTRLEH
ncbi:MAG: YchJ family metal-binding protein [Chloroflexota bacterium]